MTAASLRLARALGGRAPEAGGEFEWTGGGRVAPRLRSAASRAFEALRFLDPAAGALAARPLLVTAAALVVLPVSRIAGTPAAGIAALAVAGLSWVCAAAEALHDAGERRIVLRAVLAGALLRLAFAAAIAAEGGFPDETGTYHPIAADAAASWRAGGASSMLSNVIVAGRAAYFELLAGLYWLTGPAVAAGRVLGCLLGLAAVLAAGEVGRALGGRRAAAFAAAALAFHPEHAFWSATLSRDTLTTSLVLVSLAAALRRPARLLAGNLAAAAVPVGILAMNSFVVAGVLAGTLVAMSLAEAVSVGGTAVRGLVVGGLAVALAAASLVFVGHRYGAWVTPEMFTAVRGKAVGVTADFLPDLEFSSWAGVAAYLPLGAAFVLGAPWPWTAVHANRAAYGVLALGGIAIAALGVAGLVASARRRPSAAAPVILFALLLLVVLAALEGNSGIVVRHRLPLTACLSASAGVVLAGWRPK